ncbi:agmatinase [Herbaspirillum sp. LeCh32-8]|uniref:agmatinase n=1 Tax=Herbaspirillum sp. LeCh32-8 TaxID=2821356 RepID=UPI001AE3C8D1|nr:agmatinase [Herbaspirillum sp. LeCh32-8]MBP0599239.1 agmatinase [Herbaspirillum sp. LeCh32-8]
MEQLTTPPRTGHKTLLYSELVTDFTEQTQLKSDIAVLGMPFGAAYGPRQYSNDQTNAPQALRELTDRMVRHPSHYDFDIDGPLLQERDDIRFVDCGDVLPDLAKPDDHKRRAEIAVRQILRGGGMPIVLGGDHGITNPVLRGFDEVGPVTLVHIDAHLDWRDEVNGVRDGLSSVIRRASELPFIKHIVQIGLRAQGSGRPADYRAAKEWGADLVTAYELHDIGMDAVLARIPDGGNYYLTIDADGLDCAMMPAVDGPAPGGVTFLQARKLIHGLVKKGRVIGMDIVEIQPAKDNASKISCVTAGRLIVNLIGATIRAGYFDKK